MRSHPGRESDSASDAIRAVEAAYDRAWGSGDIDALAGCLIADAVIVNPLGETSRGRAQIVEMLGGFLRGPGRGSTHSTAISSIDFVTDDVAIVDGMATIDGVRMADDDASAVLEHRFTDVVVRRQTGWLIAHVRAYALEER